ncbi:unnamed protein product [Coregonus sp. 'balchen']|nr:unnamed protein product [Coregonus sp. 'balchen']
MNGVSIGEYHGLRVGSALLSIVRECDADAVGGIFLGAGGLGLLISVFPFIRAWININNILPTLGNFRVQPMPANPPGPEQPAETLKREVTQSQLNLECSKSPMGTFVDAGPIAEASADEG